MRLSGGRGGDKKHTTNHMPLTAEHRMCTAFRLTRPHMLLVLLFSGLVRPCIRKATRKLIPCLHTRRTVTAWERSQLACAALGSMGCAAIASHLAVAEAQLSTQSQQTCNGNAIERMHPQHLAAIAIWVICYVLSREVHVFRGRGVRDALYAFAAWECMAQCSPLAPAVCTLLSLLSTSRMYSDLRIAFIIAWPLSLYATAGTASVDFHCSQVGAGGLPLSVLLYCTTQLAVCAVSFCLKATAHTITSALYVWRLSADRGRRAAWEEERRSGGCVHIETPLPLPSNRSLKKMIRQGHTF